MPSTDIVRPEAYQEKQYDFPYHWLPHQQGDTWYMHRYTVFGYHYLSLLNTVLGRVLALQPQRVLDFGCGDGRLTFELARAGIPEVYGLDVSQQAINFARSFSRAYPVTFTTDWTDIPSTPFDVAVAMEVIEHLPPAETADILAPVAQALKPDGVLILTTPTTNFPVQRKHYRHFTADTLARAVQPHFQIVEIRYLLKQNLTTALLHRLVANRFFVANWTPWLSLIGVAYRRFVLPATAETGKHLFAVLRKQ